MRHLFHLSLFALFGLTACQKASTNRASPDIAIENIKEEGETPGRLLSVTMKAKEGFIPDAGNIHIMSYIYERRPDGQVALSFSQTLPQWVTPPIDWKNQETESMQLQYPGPKNEEDGKYYGYVIAVYSSDKLQDYRSQPPDLVERFPLTNPRSTTE